MVRPALAPTRIAGLLATAAVATLCAPLHAQEPRKAVAVVKVVVRVPQVVRLDVLARPPHVWVTPADIARGYIESPFPMQLAVHSNVREGYSLMLSNTGGFVDHAVVSGLGSEFRLRPGAMSVPRASVGTGLRRDFMQLAIRLVLSPAAQPGSYAWPIQVGALGP